VRSIVHAPAVQRAVLRDFGGMQRATGHVTAAQFSDRHFSCAASSVCRNTCSHGAHS
jgi:hypothetical protein